MPVFFFENRRAKMNFGKAERQKFRFISMLLFWRCRLFEFANQSFRRTKPVILYRVPLIENVGETIDNQFISACVRQTRSGLRNSHSQKWQSKEASPETISPA